MANSVQNVGFGLGEYGAEQADIERRRAYAQALQAQGAQPLGPTEMAGGWAVKRSPLEGLAKMLQAYSGRKGQEQATEAQGALQARRQADRGSDMTALAAMLRGTPAGPTETPSGDIYQAPAQPGGHLDPAQLGSLKTPEMQNTAMQMWLQQMQPKKPVVVGRSLLDPASGKVVGTDATWQGEQDAARKAKEAELQAKLADARVSREERAEAQRQLAEMQLAGRKELATMAAGMRQPQSPVAVMGPDGKSVYVSPDKAVGRQPAGGGRSGGMSATAQKELIETEEQMQGGQSALDLFKQAKALNDKAMGFTGAGALASAGTLLPEALRPDTVNATQNLDNILQTAALPQLKAIFGGMPTEGERKILLDVQGSSSKPASVRKEIFKRAEAAIEARIKFAGEKAKRLREGTYFSGEGLPSLQPPDGGGRSAQDTAALEWANANPNDPRASAIKQRLGAR